jgi:hypothetical protein
VKWSRVHWIVVFWKSCWKHCQQSHGMHAKLNNNNADRSPCFSDHRTPTEAYFAWDERLTAACMSRHQVLKSGNAGLFPFPGLEYRVLCLVAGNCAALWSAHFSGKDSLCFVAKSTHPQKQLINMLSAMTSCAFWQFHSLLRRETNHVLRNIALSTEKDWN